MKYFGIHQIVDKFDKWRDQRRGIHNVLRNVNLDLTQKQQRVLICYLDYRKINNSIRDSFEHTNIAEFIQIINTFISLNFVVDICAHNALDGYEYIKDVEYDYIFGMGEVFRKISQSNQKAYIIEYFTENPYWYSKQEETKRNEYYCERTKRSIRLQRTGRYYKESDEQIANAIICMGNPKYFQNCDSPVYRILPSAFVNKKYEKSNIKEKTNNFMVFGTEGIVHKGIDILVEIFKKHSDWNLFVCGKNFKKECLELGYILSDNILDCGYIDIKSDRFIEICEKCGYIVLPSCSEGASTAVETLMCHGLIPIVMKQMIYDEPNEYFITIEDFNFDEVESKIIEAINMSEGEYEYLSDKIQKYAREEYSLNQFSYNFKRIIQDIIRKKNESSIS